MIGETDQTQPGDATEEEADDAAHVKRAHDRWRQGSDHLSAWRVEAKECFAFVSGRQWTEEDRLAMEDIGRIPVTFNRTEPVVDAISGYEINGRQEISFFPREPGDSAASDMMNAAGKWFRDEAQADDEETDAFRDALTCGLGWIDQRIDYEAEPKGKPCVDRKDPITMVYDPAARKRNLVDRNWQVEGCWWPRSKAKAMWPTKDFVGNVDRGADTIRDAGPVSDREDDRWYKPDPQGQNIQGITPARVFILRHQWRETRGAWLIANPATNQTEIISEEIYKKFAEKAEQSGMTLPKATRVAKQEYFQSFVCGDELLEWGPSPCPMQFTTNPITGKRDRNSNVWYGVVRAMLDPQKFANKGLSQTMHNINTAVKGGVISKAGAFVDGVKVEDKLAQPGWHLEMNKNAKYGDDVIFITPQQMTAITGEMWKIVEFAVTSMRDTTGVNVELLGLADREQPGVLEQQRKKSAMTILAPLFDSLRRYRKVAGEVMGYYLKTNLNDGRLVRILGKGNAQYIPLMLQADMEYDIVVDESPTTPNQQEAVFGVLMHLLPMAGKMGIEPPPELLDYVPGLPQKLRDDWKKAATKPNPKQEAAQLLEAADKVANIDKTGAQAEQARASAFKDAMGVPMEIGQMFMQVMQQVGMIAQQLGVQMPQGAPQGRPPMGQPQMPPGMMPQPQLPPPGPMPGQPPMVQ